jgi:hypothetical protein
MYPSGFPSPVSGSVQGSFAASAKKQVSAPSSTPKADQPPSGNLQASPSPANKAPQSQQQSLSLHQASFESVVDSSKPPQHNALSMLAAYDSGDEDDLPTAQPKPAQTVSQNPLSAMLSMYGSDDDDDLPTAQPKPAQTVSQNPLSAMLSMYDSDDDGDDGPPQIQASRPHTSAEPAAKRKALPSEVQQPEDYKGALLSMGALKKKAKLPPPFSSTSAAAASSSQYQFSAPRPHSASAAAAVVIGPKPIVSLERFAQLNPILQARYRLSDAQVKQIYDEVSAQAKQAVTPRDLSQIGQQDQQEYLVALQEDASLYTGMFRDRDPHKALRASAYEKMQAKGTLTAEENALCHFLKHQYETGSQNPGDYLQKAQTFLNKPHSASVKFYFTTDAAAKGYQTLVAKYDSSTGEFGGKKTDGTISTYYVRNAHQQGRGLPEPRWLPLNITE